MKTKRAPGGGRKPLATADPTKKVAVTLLASQVEAMTQLGNGNLSAGIRKAIKNMDTNKVTNSSGKAIDFDAAVNLMDDDIREQLHMQQEWNSEQEFFSAYEQAHQKKHGEEWELSKSNPVW